MSSVGVLARSAGGQVEESLENLWVVSPLLLNPFLQGHQCGLEMIEDRWRHLERAERHRKTRMKERLEIPKEFQVGEAKLR
jgi:hypothetical protein